MKHDLCVLPSAFIPFNVILPEPLMQDVFVIPPQVC